MKRPYIGITDFLSFGEVEQMLEVFNLYKHPDSKRMLHIGVMMSYRTLNNLRSRYSEVFPKREAIADIFEKNIPDVYYCLHYADYDNCTQYYDLENAILFGGDHINALQLDMVWPDPFMIRTVLHRSGRSGKNIEVILQIGKNAIEIAGNNPAEVVRRLRDYNGSIHRVLLDKSMGGGIPMNALEFIPFIKAIKDNFPDMGIGVAGGLGPETTHLVEPLIRQFPNVSIDAQGKLRPSGDILDPIDWKMAEKYLIQALKLVQEN